MKKILNLAFIASINILLLISCKDSSIGEKVAVSDDNLTILQTKVTQIKTFIKKNKKYNDSVAFFIDMKIHSGKKRFFVYDLKKKEIIDQGLVTHGEGSESANGLVFKNIPNSLATSLGKYAIGYSYNGDFGKAYKMHGLETSNDKAFERFIVFHSHECVPNEERKKPICLSQGCPTVSPEFLERVATIIDNSPTPILMEIYYGM